jgi:hypothetical protein
MWHSLCRKTRTCSVSRDLSKCYFCQRTRLPQYSPQSMQILPNLSASQTSGPQPWLRYMATSVLIRHGMQVRLRLPLPGAWYEVGMQESKCGARLASAVALPVFPLPRRDCAVRYPWRDDLGRKARDTRDTEAAAPEGPEVCTRAPEHPSSSSTTSLHQVRSRPGCDVSIGLATCVASVPDAHEPVSKGRAYWQGCSSQCTPARSARPRLPKSRKSPLWARSRPPVHATICQKQHGASKLFSADARHKGPHPLSTRREDVLRRCFFPLEWTAIVDR